MFCSECGTKNKEDALFCENCGHKLEQAKIVKKTKTVKKTPKKINPITYIVIAVIAVLIGAYIFIGNMFTPAKVAEGFFKAVTSLDADKLYDYIDVEKSEFTSKKVFKKIIESSKEDKVELLNYKVEKAEISKDKLSATVKISYVEKKTNKSDTLTVRLVKDKTKKLLLFDNWKISTNGYSTIKDFKIELPKGSTIEIEGIKLDKKYIDKEDNKKFDIYVMPAMFSTNYNVKVTLPVGIEIEDKMSVNSYSNYDVDIDEDNLSDKMKKQLTESSKKVLENLYNGAKDKKSWDEVKSNFEVKDLDTSKVKSTYESLVSSLGNASTTLTSLSFTKIELNRVSLDNDGNLYLSIKASYDYSVSYQSGDETKTNKDDDYDYLYLTFGYKDKEFKLVNATSLNTYFSRY